MIQNTKYILQDLKGLHESVKEEIKIKIKINN